MRRISILPGRLLIVGLLVVFLITGVLYPALRVELLAKTGVPSAVAGSWQDVLIALLMLTVLLSLRIRVKGTSDPVSLGVGLIAVCAVLSLTVALAYGVNPKAIVYALRLTYLPMCLYLVARCAPFRVSCIRRIHAVLFGVFTFATCMGILFSFFLTDYWLNLVVRNSAEREWGLDAIARVGGFRMTGTLLDPVTFGTLSAWGVILGINLFRIGNGLWRNAVVVVCVILCVLGAVLSLTRGAWLLCVIGVLISLVAWFRRRLVSSAAILICMAVGVLFLLSVHDGDLLGLVTRTWSKTVTEANVQRDEMWADAFYGFLEHPFGFGLGTVGHIGERFHDELGIEAPIITDGWYHKILAEGGVPLFISFCAFEIFTVVTLWRLVLRANESSLRAFRTACLAIFFGSCIQALASNLWDLYFISHLLWLIVGLAAHRSGEEVVVATATVNEGAPVGAVG